jgi:hypothetical protein
MLKAKDAALRLKNLPIKVSKDVEKQLNDSVLRAIEE